MTKGHCLSKAKGRSCRTCALLRSQLHASVWMIAIDASCYSAPSTLHLTAVFAYH